MCCFQVVKFLLFLTQASQMLRRCEKSNVTRQRSHDGVQRAVGQDVFCMQLYRAQARRAGTAATVQPSRLEVRMPGTSWKWVQRGCPTQAAGNAIRRLRRLRGQGKMLQDAVLPKQASKTEEIQTKAQRNPYQTVVLFLRCCKKVRFEKLPVFVDK